MKDSLRDKLVALVERYEEVGRLLGEPATIGDKDRFRELSKEYARLAEVADNFDAGSSRVLYDLITAEGERISLRFDGATPVSTLKRGDRLRVSGRLIADTLT